MYENPTRRQALVLLAACLMAPVQFYVSQLHDERFLGLGSDFWGGFLLSVTVIALLGCLARLVATARTNRS